MIKRGRCFHWLLGTAATAAAVRIPRAERAAPRLQPEPDAAPASALAALAALPPPTRPYVLIID